MRFLISLVHAIHLTMGITTPRPDQERAVVFVWLGIVAVFAGGFGLWIWWLQGAG